MPPSRREPGSGARSWCIRTPNDFNNPTKGAETMKSKCGRAALSGTDVAQIAGLVVAAMLIASCAKTPVDENRAVQPPIEPGPSAGAAPPVSEIISRYE